MIKALNIFVRGSNSVTVLDHLRMFFNYKWYGFPVLDHIDWRGDMVYAFIRDGFIKGELLNDGAYTVTDEDAAEAFIQYLIDYIFRRQE